MNKHSKNFTWVLGVLLTLASMFVFEIEAVKKLIDPLTVVYVAVFIIIILAFSYSLNNLFHNEKLENSIKDLNEAMKSINMGWLISETKVAEIEKEAKEIWVFQDSLEKDYDLKSNIGNAVRDNLKKGKKYTYFLPIHAFTAGQVQSFEDIFNSYKEQFKFVLVANDSIFIHSEIVLYNPTNNSSRNAVEFLPSNNDVGDKVKYYVNLDKDRANNIWSLGNTLIKKDEDEIDPSMFLLDNDVAKIEESANKIWVIKNEVGYDIVQTFDSEGKKNGHPIHLAVEKNLKYGKEYTYFLRKDTSKKNISDRKEFEEIFKNYIEYFQFIPLSGHCLYIHSEIVIYEPGSENMHAIELVASRDPEKPPIYVRLTEDSVKSIYSICNKIKKSHQSQLKI